MKLLFISVRFLTVLILIGVFVNDIKAAPEEVFAVAIQAEKESYLKGEPVALLLTVSYLGANAVDVPNPLDKRGYEERVDVSVPGKVEFRRLFTIEEAANELADRTKLPRVHFEPGSKVVRTNWYQCWPDVLGDQVPKGLVFPDPGAYPIRAKVVWQNSAIYATAVVTVTPLLREIDQQAYGWLEKSGKLCSLSFLFEHGRDPKDYGKYASRYRDLREQYPGSVFTAFLDRTYMSASNIIRRSDAKFLNLLGDKPKAVAVQNEAP